MTTFARRAFAATFTAAALATIPVPALAAWEPTKPITFVVTGGAGGGADQMARLIQGIAAKHKLTNQPFVVQIMNGGGGGQGFMDVKESTGDPHKVIFGTNNAYLLPYVAKLASLAGVEMRIVNKAAGQSLLERHKSPDDRTATPTIVLLRDGKDAGAFVERPVTLQTWMIGAARALSQQERLSRKTSWYEWDRGDSTVAEVVALAEKTAR